MERRGENTQWPLCSMFHETKDNSLKNHILILGISSFIRIIVSLIKESMSELQEHAVTVLALFKIKLVQGSDGGSKRSKIPFILDRTEGVAGLLMEWSF